MTTIILNTWKSAGLWCAERPQCGAKVALLCQFSQFILSRRQILRLLASTLWRSETFPALRTRESDHAECGGVTIPTPFVEFWQRSLYHARIAFLWGAMAISKESSQPAIYLSAKPVLSLCTALFTVCSPSLSSSAVEFLAPVSWTCVGGFS